MCLAAMFLFRMKSQNLLLEFPCPWNKGQWFSFQGNNPYGMIKRLGVPDTLITPPSEWNERCYDTSLSNPNILTDGCGYHQGVDESQIEILLDYALPDETHKKPIEIKSEETRTGTTTQSITIIEHEE